MNATPELLNRLIKQRQELLDQLDRNRHMIRQVSETLKGVRH